MRRFLKNLTVGLLEEPAVPLFGKYLSKSVSTPQTYWHPFVIYVTVSNNKMENKLKCLWEKEKIKCGFMFRIEFYSFINNGHLQENA